MYTYLTCYEGCASVNIPDFDKLLGEIEKTFGNEKIYYVEFIRLNGRKYQSNIIESELHVLFSIARNLWRQSEDVILTEMCNPNFGILNTRSVIVDLLAMCRYTLVTIKSEKHLNSYKNTLLFNISLLKRSMIPLHCLNENALSKLASNKISGGTTPTSIFLHMYLDIIWLIISIEHICKQPNDVLLQNIECVLKDLVSLSKLYFNKIKGPRALDESPFVCLCVKKMWILIKKFTEKLSNNTEKFWEIYNKILINYEEEFSFYLFTNVILNNFYDLNGNFEEEIPRPYENQGHVDQKLKVILSKPYNELNSKILRNCLHYMENATRHLWLDILSVEPYQLLWDYFFKNINNLKTEILTSTEDVCEFINSIDMIRIQRDVEPFYVFLSMLLHHLKNYVNTQHWAKMKGRIYSRLSVNKLRDLNETGIFNISMLFLTLCKYNLEELTTKYKEILPHLGEEKMYVETKWVMKMALAAMYVRHKHLIDQNFAESLAQMADKTTDNRDQFYLMKIYINALEYITTACGNYMLNQSILYGNWIKKYSVSCQTKDLPLLIRVLTYITENLISEVQIDEWKPIYLNIILPSIKEIATNQSAPSQTGRLAAIITQNFNEVLISNLRYFTGDNINTKIISKFIGYFLDDFPKHRLLNTQQEQIITQGWTKFALFNVDNNDSYIKKLKKFTLFSYVNLQVTPQPFMALINAISEQQNNKIYSIQLRELCQVCFGNLDKCITLHLMHNQNEASVLIVYTNISYLFLNIPGLLYNKVKSNCVLSRLINVLLLPTDVLIGKIPNLNVLKSLEKTWHLFFEGLFKLSPQNDVFIDKTLKDLIVRYLPHFSVSDSPFFKCPDHNKFILDKICAGFVAQTAKTSEENVFKALKIVYLLLENANDIGIMRFFIQKCFVGVLEVIMFQNQKLAAIELVKLVAISSFYIEIRSDLKRALLLVMEKHLAFSSNNYFQLATTLIQLLPLDMKDLLPDVKKQITIVERMRGVGFDNILRQYLNRYETCLSSQ